MHLLHGAGLAGSSDSGPVLSPVGTPAGGSEALAPAHPGRWLCSRSAAETADPCPTARRRCPGPQTQPARAVGGPAPAPGCLAEGALRDQGVRDRRRTAPAAAPCAPSGGAGGRGGRAWRASLAWQVGPQGSGRQTSDLTFPSCPQPSQEVEKVGIGPEPVLAPMPTVGKEWVAGGVLRPPLLFPGVAPGWGSQHRGHSSWAQVPGRLLGSFTWCQPDLCAQVLPLRPSCAHPGLEDGRRCMGDPGGAGSPLEPFVPESTLGPLPPRAWRASARSCGWPSAGSRGCGTCGPSTSSFARSWQRRRAG